MARSQHLSETLFGGIGITGGTQHEVYYGAYRVYRPIEIIPVLFDSGVRLVHTVGIIRRIELRSPLLRQLCCVALDAAEYRGVVDPHAAFAPELFHITIAQGVP